MIIAIMLSMRGDRLIFSDICNVTGTVTAKLGQKECTSIIEIPNRKECKISG